MTTPAPVTTFDSLSLNPSLLNNLTSLGYHQPTSIQTQSLPIILSGEDLIAQSKTGSGKTAAFGLGLLQQLDSKDFTIQGLVLCPTRELADQVAEEIRRLARQMPNVKVLTLCGGSNLAAQQSSLEQGAHIIVGTPGRIEEHLRQQTLSLSGLKTLVLDEADRMLEMGFQPAIEAILATLPTPRQTLLFSATFPDAIAQMASHVMHNPITIKVAAHHDPSSINQAFYRVDTPEQRFKVTRLLLLQHRPNACVIFCNTKKDAQAVADQLLDAGFSAAALHGDLEQRDRDQTLIQFANHSIAVLVATDVAARGLDISDLDGVINYHLAQDPEVHIHRIGRTGRAGQTGWAASLISDKESYKVAMLSDYLAQTIVTSSLPHDSLLQQPPLQATMTTLQLDAGKKDKLRPGDIVGALTAHPDLQAEQIGKIKVTDVRSYVAVSRHLAKQALVHLNNNKLKGKKVRVKALM